MSDDKLNALIPATDIEPVESFVDALRRAQQEKACDAVVELAKVDGTFQTPGILDDIMFDTSQPALFTTLQIQNLSAPTSVWATSLFGTSVLD